MDYLDIYERRAAILTFTYENPQSARAISESLGMNIRDVSNDLTMLTRQGRILKSGNTLVKSQHGKNRSVPCWESAEKFTRKELEDEMYARKPPEQVKIPDYPPRILIAFGYNTLPEPQGRFVDNSHIKPVYLVSKHRVWPGTSQAYMGFAA